MASVSSDPKIPAFSMVLGYIIHVLGRPRCGLYCVGESSMKFLTNAIFSGCFVAVTKPEIAGIGWTHSPWLFIHSVVIVTNPNDLGCFKQ